MFESLTVFSVSIATIGAGLMAGVYFAFSAFIMRSLDRLGAVEATDATNAINEVILRSSFMLVFFGTTVLYAVLALVALVNTELPGRWLLFAAGVIYVVGMFVCTAVFNVPLNNRLAGAGSSDEAIADRWSHYLKNWTRWNHFRGICSLATALLSIDYLIQYP